MNSGMSRLVVFLFLLLPMLVRAEPDLKSRGGEILQAILAQPWAESWRGASLAETRLVSQKEDLAQPTGLPPVWYAVIEGPDEKKGYLMWESEGVGRLVEFALDDALPVKNAIEGVPALQQFPYQDPEHGTVASGCVPTSAASLVGYWRKQEGVGSGIAPEATLPEITLHLRQRLDMVLFPDRNGFTGNGMPLAGALPSRMADVLNKEAKARKIPLKAAIMPFSMDRFRGELAEGRPVLLACTVRLPHKPSLSWGHAVVGLAAATIDGVELVGIHDNFYPTSHPEAIRWIHEKAFRVLTVVRPEETLEK